jgi:hypothetical protein
MERVMAEIARDSIDTQVMVEVGGVVRAAGQR